MRGRDDKVVLLRGHGGAERAGEPEARACARAPCCRLYTGLQRNGSRPRTIRSVTVPFSIHKQAKVRVIIYSDIQTTAAKPAKQLNSIKRRGRYKKPRLACTPPCAGSAGRGGRRRASGAASAGRGTASAGPRCITRKQQRETKKDSATTQQ